MTSRLPLASTSAMSMKRLAGDTGFRVVILDLDVLKYGDVLGEDQWDKGEDHLLPFLLGPTLRRVKPLADRVADEDELIDLGLQELLQARVWRQIAEFSRLR